MLAIGERQKGRKEWWRGLGSKRREEEGRTEFRPASVIEAFTSMGSSKAASLYTV
jgi:hypothetical protein